MSKLSGRGLGLCALFAALTAFPAFSQNLLVNPGFNRDLSGWTVATTTYPEQSTSPGYVEGSAEWTANDRSANPASGGLAAHVVAYWMSAATAHATQCVAIGGGQDLSYGASFLVSRQRMYGSGDVKVEFFSSVDCSGTTSGSWSASPPGYPIDGLNHSSNGAWLQASGVATSPDGTRSVRFSVGARATGYFSYAPAWADIVADDAYMIGSAGTLTTSLLPSAAWLPGALGSSWNTGLTLVNADSADAAVTLKWLGHDVDGRTGREFTFLIPAGQILAGVDANFSANFQGDYGAILMTSSSPLAFLQSETSTILAPGGSVGQALGAFSTPAFATSTPRSLTPIRENASFRTNLVLANPTEVPVTAHVVLYGADGAVLGTRDAALFPLGMTQISRVAAALGAPSLDAGRIEVSTPTPGGSVAAYASVIDNVTNDPRTVLPQGGLEGAASSSPNLLVNPGFDRDLSGWTSSATFSPPNMTLASAAWDSSDAQASATSGSAAFHMQVGRQEIASISLSQCVDVQPSRPYVAFAKVRIARQQSATVLVNVTFYDGAACVGTRMNGAAAAALVPPLLESNDSGGAWLSASAQPIAQATARSARFELLLYAAGSSGAPTAFFDGAVDDAFFGLSAAAASILPSAAHVPGSGGSVWTTDLTLANHGMSEAVVTLKSLGHDRDGRDGAERSLLVGAGAIVGLRDILGTLFGVAADYGAIRVSSSSANLVVESETSTPALGGTVGQALPAFSDSHLTTAKAKSLAPVREDAYFRTNLVLANPSEVPVTAHVVLYGADGSLLGTRDVSLPPLGMTQISRVAAALGAPPLDAGRIEVSTPTPGGSVAAYASVIDNVTNDPRTLLPQ